MVSAPRLLCVIFSLAVSAVPGRAAAMRTFPDFQPSSLPKGDDVSTPAVPLGFNINFLGQSSSAAYVNTNGDITFNSSNAAYPGMPGDNMAGGVIPPISSATQPLVNAFLSDIDAPGTAVGSITYGATTLAGRPAFVVNYSNVAYFNFTGVDFDVKHNSFQIVLVERSDTGPGNFDIELNYDQIQWETADSNGGTGGFGGYAALVGYSNGSRLPGTFFALPGSGVPGSFADGAALSLVAGSFNSGVAGRYIFEIRNGIMAVLTSLSPATVVAGGAPFTLTVNGAGFAAHSTVLWNGSPVPTTFVSTTRLTAAVPANLIASQSAATVTVSAGGVSSDGLGVTIAAPLSITSLNPSTIPAGSAAFTLALSGAGFAADSIVLWNGAPLPTTFVSTTQLTAAVAANLVASQSAATVTVSAGGVSSNGLGFTIAAPPSVLSLNPSTAPAGSPAFTLTVNGSGFTSNSTALWNGAPLPTTFVSATQLTATVAANLVASQSAATVTVSAGGVSSDGLGFTIAAPFRAQPGSSTAIVEWRAVVDQLGSLNPLTAAVALASGHGERGIGRKSPRMGWFIGRPPSITSLNPPAIPAGSAAFTLTLSGAGFAADSIALWNGSPLPTTWVSATQLTATVAANLVASQGTATVTVSVGEVSSNGVPFTIAAPPSITSLNPSTIPAGSAAFTLALSGAGFAADSVVLWNGAPLPTTSVSATQLTAAVPANLVASQSAATVTVSAGGVSSNGLSFNIAAPPFLISLNPPMATAGSAAFTLALSGAGFAADSIVLWNGASLPTTFVSPTQLTAVVAANLVALQSAAAVTVSETGVSSNGLGFAIAAPPSLLSLNPSAATVGSPSFMLTMNGSGFTANSTALWNGAPLPTTFVSTTQLTATVDANLVASQGAATVTVSAGEVSSNGAPFAIAEPPSITSLNPSTILAGSAEFALTVNGSGFNGNSAALWNGSPLPTSFGDVNHLTVIVPANLIASQGAATVVVSDGGTASNTVAFTIAIPDPIIAIPNPVITMLSPSTMQAGGASFILTLSGLGFAASSVVFWNGIPLPTTLGSESQVTALVPGELVASSGIASVTLKTGGVPSNSAVFTITPAGVPSITSLSPAAVQAGGSSFTLTVNGSGFTDSLILWDGAVMPTTFVSANQLTAVIPSNLIASPWISSVTVRAGGRTTSNALAFAITATAPITSLSPFSVERGSSAFILTVNGSAFSAESVILWNGSPLATGFVNPNRLTASISSNLIAAQGAVVVTVRTRRTETNGLVFTVTDGSITGTQ